MRLQGFGEDDRGHDGGEASHQGEIRSADHAGVQMFRRLAEIGGALADPSHTVAASEPRGRGEDGRVRSAVEGERGAPGETIGDGGRRVGSLVHGGGDETAARRLP